jgi:D-alanine-D-alanine ligase
LIEKFIKNFTEYNVAVRKVNGKIETSEIEKPISSDEILSFADKYQRGGKKTGGMASLLRELPAKISKTLEKEIKQLAVDVFKAIRGKGMIRIDFMVQNKNIYVTEVNPIPGSMSFYLWEASGISFKQQITDLIEQSIIDNEERLSKRLEYKTDIIEKFVHQ